MRRSIQLALVAAISTLTGTWLWAQTPTKAPLDAQLSTPFDAPADVKTPVPEGAKAPGGPAAKPAEFASSPPLPTTTVEAINLRNQFIELSKKKALLMKEPEIKREIQLLERQIPELEAQEAIQLIEGHGRLVPVREEFRIPDRGRATDKQFRRDNFELQPVQPQPVQPQPETNNFSS
jgi:hypothetical protein